MDTKRNDLQPQELSLEVLLEKYAKGEERTVSDVRWRVAQGLAQAEKPEERELWAARFFEGQQDGVILGGRINSTMGSSLKASAINCFVQGVGDSVSVDEGGVPSIYRALADAAETMRKGGGVGYDFTPIRPNGAKVRGTQSRASGPLSYMDVFDASCAAVESAGARRGAQMGVLSVEHPDIEAFIEVKKGAGKLRNFNLSVGVSDAFMQAVEADGVWDLVHIKEPDPTVHPDARFDASSGKWIYRSVRARDLWTKIMETTYSIAEPGVLFLDTVARENNLAYCETLRASNPCGEQMLPPAGCCCLGQILLTQLVQTPFTGHARFDFEALERLTALLVRMLDNTLDQTVWPLPEQEREAQAKRRVGAGFIGLGDALIMLGLRYDSDEGRAMAVRITTTLRDAAYRASIELAKERGSFPLLDTSRYLESGFAKRLPADIRDGIRQHGVRNSHLLSIAPTGTIAIAFADNASNGIEPAFSWSYTRRKRQADGSTQEYEVEDYAYRLFRHLGGDTAKLPPAFVSALEMSAMDHLAMVAAIAPLVDSAISKTVNVPAEYPYADFCDLYLHAWRAGVKGITTYRPNSTLGSVLSVTPAAPAEQPQQAATQAPAKRPDEDPLRKQFDQRPSGDLQGVTTKIELFTTEGRKSLYVTCNFMTVHGVLDGQDIVIDRPMEFFLPSGQRDDGHQWVVSTMRMLSFVARSGGSVAKAIQAMRQVVWDKGPVRYGVLTKEDGTTRPLFHDSEVAAIGYALQEVLRKRGFIDAAGNQVPVAVLAKLQSRSDAASPAASATLMESPHMGTTATVLHNGKKCPDCGAHAVRKVDGCDRCSSCGWMGSCG